MVFGSVESRRVRLRALVGMLGVAAVAVTIAATPADAARKKRKHATAAYSPPYAAMVVDARTGRTLHAVNEDAPRIPASITKVMTLYVLFEQLERGRLTMNSQLTISANAARESPSKIGFRPGQTISVRDAILAVITKSANDVATAIGENIAGSETEFARMMTARARSLGMSRTTFYNAHGLPHSPPNITTARDLTILARAIQERFPRYYPMFSTRVFNFANGASYRNHNKLLGRVEGVDGIKTGYTNLSGFNLMTSAKSDGRHIVSVVLGGRSGASRDRIMADLVASTLPRAATTGRAPTMVAEAPEVEGPPRRPAAVAAPQPVAVAEAAPEPAPMPVPRPRMQQPEPEIPAAARAYTALSATTTPIAPPRPIRAGAPPLQISNMRAVTATTTPSAMRWSIGAPPADGKVLRPPANVDVTSSIKKVAEPEEQPAVQQVAEVRPQPARAEQRRAEPAPVIAEKKVEGGITTLAKAAAEPRPAETRSAPAVASGKWIIQIGATDDEAKAKEILARARSKAAGPLADASGFTEKVERGGTTLFRARFAGFDDSKDANNACAKLKRDGFACFAARS